MRNVGFDFHKSGIEAKLTLFELRQGWHFCGEFDGLLVGPKMHELNFCKCLDKNHEVYKAAPPV